MLRVGLTGGLASGKSTVGRMLADRGAAVFDADQLVRDLYRPGGAAERAARDLFGEAILDENGAVDRARIAEIVFRDPARRHALEARIHPIVREERERRFGQAAWAGARVAVCEATLLFEAGSEDEYDRVLLVVAPEEARVERWIARGGTEEDARRRLAAQMPPEEAARRADEVIVNSGSPEELRRQVEEVWGRWLALEGN
ncbi:MAG TPA: dephospho-CoA kinase [Thermoanaerobaculia bacterium]|nr:dephospho-CoA kinase [Thermoanaerobaculia bacterium]